LHERGYRARVTDIARVLGLKGTVENLDDGRVKIIAEGDEDKLKWFEEAICIKNTLIDVSSIEKEYSLFLIPETSGWQSDHSPSIFFFHSSASFANSGFPSTLATDPMASR
jgi:acylphosphatase